MARQPNTTVTVIARDPEGIVEKLANDIRSIGSAGHSFEIVLDPDLTEEEGGNKKFYWDGDGSDCITAIRVVKEDDYSNREGLAPETIIEIDADDEDGTLEALFKAIGECGNGGHGFSIDVDPRDRDIVGENPNHTDGPHYYWDGDGGQHINKVTSKEVDQIEEAKKKKKKKNTVGAGWGAINYYVGTYPTTPDGEDNDNDADDAAPADTNVAISEAKKINEDFVDDWNSRVVANQSLGGQKHGGEIQKKLDNLIPFEVGSGLTKERELTFLEKLDADNDFYMYTSKFNDPEQYKLDMVELLVMIGTMGIEARLYHKHKLYDKYMEVNEEWKKLTKIAEDFKAKGKMSEEVWRECMEAAKSQLTEISKKLETSFNEYAAQQQAQGEDSTASKPEGESADDDHTDTQDEEPHSRVQQVEEEPVEDMNQLEEIINRYESSYDFNDPRQVRMDVADLLKIREEMMIIKYHFKKTGQTEKMQAPSDNIKVIDTVLKDIIKQAGLEKDEVEQYKQAALVHTQELRDDLAHQLPDEEDSQRPQPEKPITASQVTGTKEDLFNGLKQYLANLAKVKSNKRLKGDKLKAAQKHLRDEMSTLTMLRKALGMDQNEFEKLYKKAERVSKNNNPMQKESINKKLAEADNEDAKGKGEGSNPSSLEAERGHGDGGHYITVDGHQLSYEQFLEDYDHIGGNVGDSDWKKIKGLYARMSVFGNMSRAEYNNYLRGIKGKLKENEEVNEDIKVNMGHDYRIMVSLKQVVSDIIKAIAGEGGNVVAAKKIVGANKVRIEKFFKMIEGMPEIKDRDYHAMLEDFASDLNVPEVGFRKPMGEAEKPCTMCEMAQIVDDTKLNESKIDVAGLTKITPRVEEQPVYEALEEHYRTGCKACREKAVTEAMQRNMSADRLKQLAERAVIKESGKARLDEASKVNLKLTSNTKRELIKKAKTALDAIYQIYDIAEKQSIDAKQFTKEIDKGFEGINELLTILVVQDSVEKK